MVGLSSVSLLFKIVAAARRTLDGKKKNTIKGIPTKHAQTNPATFETPQFSAGAIHRCSLYPSAKNGKGTAPVVVDAKEERTMDVLYCYHVDSILNSAFSFHRERNALCLWACCARGYMSKLEDCVSLKTATTSHANAVMRPEEES